jgi:Rieske Fe-S protein
MSLKQFIKIQIFCITTICILPACEDDKEEVPYTRVNFRISIYDPEFTGLNSIGNAVYVSGGINGIVVMRTDQDRYVAFDRTCTYNIDAGCAIKDTNGLSTCPCCGSQFSLYNQGMVTRGPASKMLRQYNADFDGEYIYVYSDY